MNSFASTVATQSTTAEAAAAQGEEEDEEEANSKTDRETNEERSNFLPRL